jgi:hypothetical protein
LLSFNGFVALTIALTFGRQAILPTLLGTALPSLAVAAWMFVLIGRGTPGWSAADRSQIYGLAGELALVTIAVALGCSLAGASVGLAVRRLFRSGGRLSTPPRSA